MKKQVFYQTLKKFMVLSFLIDSISIPVGLLTSEIISDITTAAVSGTPRQVFNDGIFLVSLIVVYQMFRFILVIPYKKAEKNAVQDCKNNLYKFFIKAELSLLHQTKQGEILERFHNDFDQVTGRYLNLYPRLIKSLLTAVIYVAYLTTRNWMVAGILLLLSFMQLIPPMIVKKFLQVNYDQCEEVEAELSDYTIEGYRGFADIKIYALKDWYIDKLKNIHKRYLKISVGTTLASRGEEAMFRFLDQILKYGAYGVLGLLVLYELASMECVISAIALSASLFGSVKAIFESIPDLAVTRTAEFRIAPWLTYNQSDGECPSDFNLTMRNVCYSVPDLENKNNILHDVDLKLNKEDISIITGKNGSGKSTLIKLLMGILKPDAGDILINGEKIEKFRDISKVLLYLPQDDADLSLTADELLSLLPSEKCDTAKKILSDFGLTDEIIKTTPIGMLSGGERKKVFLSYTLSGGAETVLLDEPTNMLDDGSRKILSEHLLARKADGKGAIIITHDAKLMSLADNIYHIDKGVLEIEK